MINVIILLLIAIYIGIVIRKLLKDKKNGVCTGCTGKSCASCSQFSSKYFDELIKKAKKA